MKKNYQKIHIYLSIFFLPFALLYAVTGILYLTHYSGGKDLSTYKVDFEKQLTKEELADFGLKFLHEKNIKFRNMDVSFAKNRIQIGLMANYARISQSDGKIKIDVYKGNIIRYLMSLHFGQGKWYFDVLGIAFGAALAIFYLTGILMVKHHSKHKKPLWISFFLGLGVVIVVGYLNGA
ncbi:PepSY-associated TM helix domain-containing protein [Helicobacter sp. 11S03491-1]|uniref:PepSY-associated TM helix domain-containing protein n=1 Tax=Helicobacter sp. 11S03491-1 TaxID=1476196 RepID=UPI000BA773EC|nr:PepSY-associated TM helix domain-containing protein [Helicobacter sp. 11S03491-1]PAF41682.1 hypothetical protein BKH45_06210 [Helicobacter sp. 11S03491-1]